MCVLSLHMCVLSSSSTFCLPRYESVFPPTRSGSVNELWCVVKCSTSNAFCTHTVCSVVSDARIELTKTTTRLLGSKIKPTTNLILCSVSRARRKGKGLMCAPLSLSLHAPAIAKNKATPARLHATRAIINSNKGATAPSTHLKNYIELEPHFFYSKHIIPCPSPSLPSPLPIPNIY